MDECIYSIVIPAHNEEKNLETTVKGIQQGLKQENIPYEIILVDDNSTDCTKGVISALMAMDNHIHLVERAPPAGFGRAVRSGIEAATGDVVTICMADSSDDPKDVVTYYRKLEEGYDCVFGSRFLKESTIENYPIKKLIVNRIVNRCIKFMFRCKFNDLTNAFKAYRMDVIQTCGPYRSCHFNITLEMSLSALIRKYTIAQIPINWYGRTWGSSKMSIRSMGRRYLEVLLKVYVEKILISDDIETERLAHHRTTKNAISKLHYKIIELEKRLDQMEKN